MQLTKGAIGNLINRYRAVLKKCHLLNVFGSLAVAGMLVMGGAAAAGAATATAKILINGTDYTDTAESVFGNFSFYSYKKACGQKRTVRGSKNSRRLSNDTPAI